MRCLTVWAGCWWSCVLLAVVSSDCEKKHYQMVGTKVVLKPGSVSGPVTSIVWKDGPNLACQWDPNDAEVSYYRQFTGRGSLNTSTGELTITGLTKDDSASYTPEINNVKGAPICLVVLSPVPVPTVNASCNERTCTLTCNVNTEGVEPVTYRWRSDDTELRSSSVEHRVTKEDSLNVMEFSCVVENPVSSRSSEPIGNPFIAAPATPTPSTGPVNINIGITVFIVLVTAVLLVAVIHRLKAGMWFFEKEAMPWEADFWRKPESSRRDAADSNGTAALREKGQDDEETPRRSGDVDSGAI